LSENPIQLSIVAAVYNAESTFGDTLRCVFESEIPCAFEVVVVDDASTDGTLEVCEAFDVKLIALEKNIGPAKARNRAVEESTGEIILFIDSDVLFGPELIGEMLARMEAEPEAAGVGSLSAQEALNPGFYSNYFAMQEWEWITGAVRMFGDEHGLGMCTRCGTLRRSVFEEMGGFDEKFTEPSIEDYDLSVRILEKYRFIWDEALEHQHYFPESLGAICRRYHRNTRDVVGLMGDSNVKRAKGLGGDSRARLALGISVLCGLLSLVYAPLVWSACAFLLGAVICKSGLYELLLRQKGFLFCLGGFAVYVVSSIFVLTGAVAGFAQRSGGASGSADV
jgi:glycosyltransferase involved in cell wall biosynthesis